MFKKVLILLISLTVFLSTPLVSFAQSAEELQSQIDQYIQKLDELGKSKNTLSNQIKLLDSQYQLTLLKITQTENSIKKLEKEIADLIVEIDKLEINTSNIKMLQLNECMINNLKIKKSKEENINSLPFIL